MKKSTFFGGACRKRLARRRARDLITRSIATTLSGLAVGDLERLAGLDPEARTGFWTRYAYTPSPIRLAEAGRRALLARIAERVMRGDLALPMGTGHG